MTSFCCSAFDLPLVPCPRLGLTEPSFVVWVQLVEGGLNASKPGDISSAAADLITEIASTEQV